MDVGTLITLLVGASAALGGFLGGKRRSNAAAIETAVGVVELLQAKIETLVSDKGERDQLISELRVRIEVLESLVTRRADVESVVEEIAGVRGVVDRIALKMEA